MFDTYFAELSACHKISQSKQEFHKLVKPILHKLSKDSDFLSNLITTTIFTPGFWNRPHYPVPSFPIFRCPDFELVANCWVPYPFDSELISTKSLHHHGPMLLSTVTAFGPGYYHFLFNPAPDDSSDVVPLTLNTYDHHSLHHIAFVDAYHIHVPMYPISLSITYALWTNSTNTSFLDTIKSLPFIQAYKKLFIRLITLLKLTSRFQLKSYKSLDYEPVSNGFRLIPERSLTEYKLGPVQDRIQTIFSILQQVLPQNQLNSIDFLSIAASEFSDSPDHYQFFISCVKSLSSSTPIPSVLSSGLHVNQPMSNFTESTILDSSSF